MSPKLKNRLFLIGFVIVFGLLGYYRDLIFRYTNAQISLLEYGGEAFPFYPGLSFLGVLSLKQLVLFKWAATLVCVALYWFISRLIIKKWYTSKSNFMFLNIAYFILLVLAACGIFLGKLVGSEQGYYFARWLMGCAQSPLVIMVLLILFIFQEKQLVHKP